MTMRDLSTPCNLQAFPHAQLLDPDRKTLLRKEERGRERGRERERDREREREIGGEGEVEGEGE